MFIYTYTRIHIHTHTSIHAEFLKPADSEDQGSPTAGYFVGSFTAVAAETHRIYVQLGTSDIKGLRFFVLLLCS